MESISVSQSTDPMAAPALDDVSRGEGGTHVRSRKPRRERKAACTSCRQQKLKCDAHLNPGKACSRCSKFGLSCVQSPGFQGSRVKSAQKSRQAQTTGAIGHNGSHERNVRPSSPAAFESRPFQVPTPATSIELSNPSNLLLPNYHSTQSRTLSGIHVDGKIIDECFQIFFQYYAPLLPIFTSPLVPNTCYQACPTLFWAIVVVGSRSLISDPTLLRALPPEVNTLALTSFQLRRNRFGEIRALLLLCTWSCPGTTMLRDNTVALSGLLLSLAMQAGLHVPNSHYGLLTGPGSESHASRQSEKTILWTHIVIVYQSIMSLGGYPSMVPLPYYSLERIPQQSIPPELMLRFKAQAIVSESESIVTDEGLDASFPHGEAVVLARIQPFLSRLDNLEVEFNSMKDSHLHIQIARLQLEVLQFYCKTDSNHQAELTKLFCTASDVLTSVKALNDTTNITSYAPSYLSMCLSLAAFTLLRMMKSSFVDLLNPAIVENGKSSFFVAIHMLTKMSLVNNDLCAKSAELLSSGWTDQTIFKASDPSCWWKLRIRNRLSMSIVFDSILVWIEEHGCDNMEAHRHSYELEADEGLDTTQPDNNEVSPFLGDDRWLYELDWNASLDVLLAEQN